MFFKMLSKLNFQIKIYLLSCSTNMYKSKWFKDQSSWVNSRGKGLTINKILPDVILQLISYQMETMTLDNDLLADWDDFTYCKFRTSKYFDYKINLRTSLWGPFTNIDQCCASVFFIPWVWSVRREEGLRASVSTCRAPYLQLWTQLATVRLN
jgi:hypothetical protein